MTPEKKTKQTNETTPKRNRLSKKVVNRYTTAMPSESTLHTTSKSNLHYTRRITPKRVTSSGAHVRGLAPGLAQLRRNVAAVASRWQYCADLTGPGFEPQTFRTDSVCPSNEANRRFVHNIKIEISIDLLGLVIYDGPSSKIWRWTLGSAETAVQMHVKLLWSSNVKA